MYVGGITKEGKTDHLEKENEKKKKKEEKEKRMWFFVMFQVMYDSFFEYT